jgi:hypothetical protein
MRIVMKIRMRLNVAFMMSNSFDRVNRSGEVVQTPSLYNEDIETNEASLNALELSIRA